MPVRSRALALLCLLFLAGLSFARDREAQAHAPKPKNALAAPSAARTRASQVAIAVAPDASTPSSFNAALRFEPNRGQTDARVDYVSRANGYTLFLTPTAAVLAPLGHESTASGLPTEPNLRLELVGANPAVHAAEGLDELPGRSNYLLGADPTRWQFNIPNYARVRYEGVYRGIDLVYYGNQRRLEYDFVVAPGADPRAIRLRLAGAGRVYLNSSGDVVSRGSDGEVVLNAPAVYQELGGVKHVVRGRYALRGGDDHRYNECTRSLAALALATSAGR